MKQNESSNEEQMKSALARKDQELSNLQRQSQAVQLLHANALQEKEDKIKQLERELNELKNVKADIHRPKSIDMSMNVKLILLSQGKKIKKIHYLNVNLNQKKIKK